MKKITIKIKNSIIAQMIGMTPHAIAKWRREKKEKNRPIIDLLDDYFANEELESYLRSQKIEKLEKIDTVENITYKNRRYYEELKQKYNIDNTLLNRYIQYIKINNIKYDRTNTPFFDSFFEFVCENDIKDDIKELQKMVKKLDNYGNMWFSVIYDINKFLSNKTC